MKPSLNMSGHKINNIWQVILLVHFLCVHSVVFQESTSLFDNHQQYAHPRCCNCSFPSSQYHVLSKTVILSKGLTTLVLLNFIKWIWHHQPCTPSNNKERVMCECVKIKSVNSSKGKLQLGHWSSWVFILLSYPPTWIHVVWPDCLTNLDANYLSLNCLFWVRQTKNKCRIQDEVKQLKWLSMPISNLG